MKTKKEVVPFVQLVRLPFFNLKILYFFGNLCYNQCCVFCVYMIKTSFFLLKEVSPTSFLFFYFQIYRKIFLSVALLVNEVWSWRSPLSPVAPPVAPYCEISKRV